MSGHTYTPDEIAKLFKISKHTVYELIKRDELHAFKVGNKMRVEESEVERFKQNMTTSSTKSSRTQPTAITHSLHLAGSHDFLVEYLVKYLSKEASSLSIQPTFIGSLEGLMMLHRGTADIAAIHLLDPTSHEYNLPFIRQLFVHEPITVMRLASREQGLIVAKGNPKNISGFQDLVRNDIMFVNRQKGSGTRFLLDSCLAKDKIEPMSIRGYENEEWNHLSTASYISRGDADIAFGIRSAANQLNLDFIPISSEQFDLVFRWTSQNEKYLQHLIDIIQLTTFKESVINLQGYDASELGTIIYEHK